MGAGKTQGICQGAPDPRQLDGRGYGMVSPFTSTDAWVGRSLGKAMRPR